jgi:hypothetical protein
MYRDICDVFRLIVVRPIFIEKYNIFYFIYTDGYVIFKSMTTYETIKMVYLINLNYDNVLETTVDLKKNRLIIFNTNSIWQIDLNKL